MSGVILLPNTDGSNANQASNLPSAPAGSSEQASPVGIIDYNAALAIANTTGTGAVSSVPVDSSGMLQVWDLPKWMTAKNAPEIWYDTRHTTEHLHELAPGENGGPGYDVNVPHSFDVRRSAVDLMKEFAAMSQNDPMKFAAIQKALADGNFYGSASTIYGGWNIQTERALAGAMESYLKVSEGAGVPVSFMQYLANTATANQQINGNAGNGMGGSHGSAITPKPELADPMALRATVQSAAQAALGETLKPSEVNRFVNEFHRLETQQFNNHLQGASYTNPDMTTAAEQFVAQNNTQGAEQYNARGYMDALLNTLLPSSSAPPNQGVNSSLTTFAQGNL